MGITNRLSAGRAFPLQIVILLGMASLCLTPRGVFAQERLNLEGTYRRGWQDAGGDRIRYFAVSYRGAFDQRVAKSAAHQAAEKLIEDDTTLRAGPAYNYPARGDNILVMGWVNESRGKWGWVASNLAIDGDLRYMHMDGDVDYARGDHWQHIRDQYQGTNFQTVHYMFGDRSNQGEDVRWKFWAPE